jgi:hypothetical protein
VLAAWATPRRQRGPDGLPDQYFSDRVDRCEEMEEKVRRYYEEERSATPLLL